MINLQYNITQYLHSNDFKQQNDIYYLETPKQRIEVKIHANEIEIYINKHKRLAYRSDELEWVYESVKNKLSELIGGLQ